MFFFTEAKVFNRTFKSLMSGSDIYYTKWFAVGDSNSIAPFRANEQFVGGFDYFLLLFERKIES